MEPTTKYDSTELVTQIMGLQSASESSSKKGAEKDGLVSAVATKVLSNEGAPAKKPATNSIGMSASESVPDAGPLNSMDLAMSLLAPAKKPATNSIGMSASESVPDAGPLNSMDLAMSLLAVAASKPEKHPFSEEEVKTLSLTHGPEFSACMTKNYEAAKEKFAHDLKHNKLKKEKHLRGDYTEATKAVVADFLENHIDGYLKRLITLISRLTFEDLFSLPGKHTENLDNYIKHVKDLHETHKVPKGKGKTVFWSEDSTIKLIRNMIKEQKDQGLPQEERLRLFDATPCVVVFYRTFISLFEGYSDTRFSYEVSKTISAVYAADSQGIVTAYFQNKKLTEGPGLLTDSAFWDTELPTLRRIDTVSEVWLYFKNVDEADWRPAVNIYGLESKEIVEVVRKSPYIVRGLYRRLSDPDLSIFQPKFVLDDEQRSKELEVFYKTAPRGRTSLKILDKIARIWILHTVFMREARKAHGGALINDVPGLREIVLADLKKELFKRDMALFEEPKITEVE